MGSKERRERAKSELRLLILDAARELFVENGYDAVTMRKVADKIEYSPTALYLHFKDKAALVRELCTVDFQAFSQSFQQVAGIADPIDRLRALGRVYVAFAQNHPQHYQLLFMTKLPEDAGPDAIKAQHRDNPELNAYAFLRALVEEAIQSGRLLPRYNNGDEVAQMLWGSLHGLVALHLTMRDQTFDEINWVPLTKITDAVSDALLSAFVAK